jgi:hypothetical protein
MSSRDCRRVSSSSSSWLRCTHSLRLHFLCNQNVYSNPTWPQATQSGASDRDSAWPDSQACFHCQYSAMLRYLRPVDQSSSLSISTAPSSLTAESSFGNILITRSRLRISSLSLSTQLVVLSLFRRHWGKTITAIASSNCFRHNRNTENGSENVTGEIED